MDAQYLIAAQKEKFKYLGAPGDARHLTMLQLPKNIQLKLSWKPDYRITKFQCHKLIAPHILAIYKRLFELDTDTIVSSGIDIFGGCYAFRAIRGTERKTQPPFSAHAWGAAIDIDPDRNGLWTKAPKANLSNPAYEPIHAIFEQHGFVNLGNIIGRDYMHFEASFDLISNPSKYL